MLASVFVADAHSHRARAWLESMSEEAIVSDWTLTEFTSALGIGLRASRITAAQRGEAEQALDAWVGQQDGLLAVQPDDVRRARSLMKGTPLPLRAGDALHLAIAAREGVALASFDIGMRRAAADLGLVVSEI